jgi:hypothetical protein
MTRTTLPLLLLVTLAGWAHPAQAQRPCDEPGSNGPCRDLYCIELVPASDFRGASGRVELGHLSGPFTIAVSPDGRPRYRLILSAAGLPDPSTLGAYRTYMAWVAHPRWIPS